MEGILRLATWNCRGGAFRRKAARIAHLRPDVLVVPECEDLDGLLLLDGDPQPTCRHRVSVPESKRGVGIFSYTGVQITPVELPGERLVFFDLYEVSTPAVSFLLGAVWTTRTNENARTYRQAHEALQRHRKLLTGSDLVLLGDFNNGAPFGRLWTDLIEITESFELVSAYHAFFGEEFGKETRPTHFHKGKVESRFHLDYCFVPASWVSRIGTVSVGAYAEWSDVSDHMPLVVDLRLEQPDQRRA